MSFVDVEYGSGEQTLVRNPIMTSATEPYGEVYANKVQTGAGAKQAWWVFDGTSRPWGAYGQPNAYTGYVYYKFVNPVKVVLALITAEVETTVRCKNFTIDGSHDGEIWETLATGLFDNDTSVSYITKEVELNNNTKYLYYRLNVIDTYNNLALQIQSVKFFGFE